MSLLPSRRNDAPDDARRALIKVFQSETKEIRFGPQPIGTRVTLLALAGLFLSLVGISMIFEIDRMVTSEFGQIVTVEPTVVMQPLDDSIIKSISVQEGDRVHKGQTLATLDETFTSSDVEALRQQIASLDAQIARDNAELAGKDYEVSHSSDTAVASYEALQKAYFDQRKSQFDAQVKAFDEQMAQAKATIARLNAEIVKYRDRVTIATDIETMRAKLAAFDAGSKLNLLLASDGKVELQRFLESDQGQLTEAEHSLSAAADSRKAFIEQWLGLASEELVTGRNQRDAAVGLLTKARKHDSLVKLDAPDDAVVLSLARLSVGSILREGSPLMTLALLKSPLEADLYILPRDVGFVREGDLVTIKLDAFNFVEHGTADGQVISISEGTFNPSPSGDGSVPAGGDLGPNPAEAQNTSSTLALYKIRVRFTKVQLQNVPASFRLIPGMTLTGDIHLGTRSLFMYLVRGLVRGFDESMREP